MAHRLKKDSPASRRMSETSARRAGRDLARYGVEPKEKNVRAYVIRYETWKGRVRQRLKNRKIDTTQVPHRLYNQYFDEGLSPTQAAKEIAAQHGSTYGYLRGR